MSAKKISKKTKATETAAVVNVSHLRKELADIQDLLNGRGGTEKALSRIVTLVKQVDAVAKRPLKHIQIGNAAVDSGMLMIVDPCYVLKPSPEMKKFAEERGIERASDSFDTNYDVASDLCFNGSDSFRIIKEKDENGKMVVERAEIFNPLDDMTNEQHRQIAYGAVCSTGRGDGTFPVYAVYEGNQLVGMEVRFED